uniref:NFRKB nuclear factor related to kappa-B-binding protein n=1 Tax=Phallusia mammillata TaxID=59560 RepID=A0A6F9DMP8_9ASCI|nr:NFRKB nuclear factor related to kappa-B-binding protein [Phallusia mammillata]
MASEIIIDGEVISLPTVLVKNPELLKDVLTTSVWENELNNEQKQNLGKLLPGGLGDEENQKTIRMLLSGEDLVAFPELNSQQVSHNPLNQFVEQMKTGFHNPMAYQHRRRLDKIKKIKHKLQKHRYYHQLLKEVIVSRQCHLAVAAHPHSFKLSVSKASLPQNEDDNMEIKESAENLYHQTLANVNTEIAMHPDFADVDVTAWESDYDTQQMHSVAAKPFHPNSNTVSFNQFKELLLQHKRRRDAKINTPDLNVNGIKLADVISRTFAGGRKLQGGLGKKRKHGDVLKNNKQKRIKGAFASNQAKAASISQNLGAKKSKYHFKYEHSNKYMTQPCCFFELIKDVLILSQEKTPSSVEQLVGGWLASAEASKYVWTTTRSDWSRLVQPALEYMKGIHQVNDFATKLIAVEDMKLQWLGQVDDEGQSNFLETLCHKWISELPDESPSQVVNSPSDEITSFRVQEQRRYLYPHQAFVYTINGKRYAVPPVKGSTGPTKEGRVAREHFLLRPERPPQVTLLALTRDAVARLPGGTGARNDVCNLIRESQYLAEVITDQQINSAVSGALDRLHYESDPCVKFDASKRLWVYLHGDRTVEELERHHVEQLGAPKKKRFKDKMKKVKGKSKMLKHGSLKNLKRQTIGNSVPSMGPVDPTALNVDQKMSKQPKQATDSADLNTQPSTPGFKPKPTKKKTKKSASQNGSSASSGTTTIQMTQKQIVEMTRKLSNPATTSQGSREVLITQQSSSATEWKDEPAKVGHTGALQKHVKGTLVPQQNGQPSLKLILKPASGQQQKPTAELVRVVDSNLKSVAKQHVLTADTLRRLSEQLSAASSRPIKIVQQSAGKPANIASQRIINISKPPENSSKQIRTVTPSSGVKLGPRPPHGGDSAPDGPRILITATRPKGLNVTSSMTSSSTGKITSSAYMPITSKPSGVIGAPISTIGAKPFQVISGGKPKTLQIMSGGKVQTVQVLSQAGKPQQTATRAPTLPNSMASVTTQSPAPQHCER